MRQRYDLTAAEPQDPTDGQINLISAHQRPVSLRAKVFCGALAGVIVMTVSSALDRRYDVAEASGATQIIIAEAQAKVSTSAAPRQMRGATGMASAQHDWVFDR